jgi:integrase
MTGNPGGPINVARSGSDRSHDGGRRHPRPAGGQQPRPYGFRHHFAYANVERWVRQGTDVTAMLPYLARYMGHASIESSYYYIHTSPDFMRAYADITAASQSLLPQVGFE